MATSKDAAVVGARYLGADALWPNVAWQRNPRYHDQF